MYYLSAPLFSCQLYLWALWCELCCSVLQCFDRRSSALSEKGIILRKELEQEQSPGDSQLVCVCVLQRKKKRKVSVKLCVLYLRVWLSYVCQPVQQSERNRRLKEYRHTVWVCVFLKHKLACVFFCSPRWQRGICNWNICFTAVKSLLF